MPNPGYSKKSLREVVSILKMTGGNRAEAAREMGIPLRTLENRVARARRDGLEVPPATKASGGAGTTAAVRQELERERKLRTKVEAQVEKLAKARNPVKLAPVKKRDGRDDAIRVVIPDSHGCFIDRGAAAAFLSDLKALDPDEVVMLGDHLSCDGFLAQHHTIGYVAQSKYSYEEDVVATNWFLDEIQKAAPRAVIHYIEGNHEQRIERWCVQQSLANAKDAEFLRSVFAPEVLLKLKDRGVTFYRRSEVHMDLPIPGTIKLGKCFFAHTGGGKNAAGGIVRKFGAPVVFGHTHRSQSDLIRTVGSGVIGAWNPGCLTELQPVYGNTDITDWSHGYAIQSVARSGLFCHFQVPILNGTSMLPFTIKGKAA